MIIKCTEPGRENREGAGSDGIGSTSGVSTVNSLKSHKALDYSSSKMHSEYNEQLEHLRHENERYLKKVKKCFYNMKLHLIFSNSFLFKVTPRSTR